MIICIIIDNIVILLSLLLLLLLSSFLLLLLLLFLELYYEKGTLVQRWVVDLDLSYQKQFLEIYFLHI